MRLVPRHTFAALAAALLICGLAAAAAGADATARPQPKILSASWGTDNAVGCPNGEQGLDNIPATFSWFIRRSSIQVTDFRIVRPGGGMFRPCQGPTWSRCPAARTSLTLGR